MRNKNVIIDLKLEEGPNLKNNKTRSLTREVIVILTNSLKVSSRKKFTDFFK